MKFSIVVPYLSSSKYIENFKKYLELNTFNEYELVEIVDETDVYYAYNRGIFTANNDIVITMMDDMVVSKNWDVNYVKYADPRILLTGYIMEVNPGSNNPTAVKSDCGTNLDNFNYNKFEYIVLQVSKEVPEIRHNVRGWTSPLCVNRRTFIGLPNFEKFPVAANDLFLLDVIAPNIGFKFGLVSSFTYHFQSNWENGHYKNLK